MASALAGRPAMERFFPQGSRLAGIGSAQGSAERKRLLGGVLPVHHHRGAQRPTTAQADGQGQAPKGGTETGMKRKDHLTAKEKIMNMPQRGTVLQDLRPFGNLMKSRESGLLAIHYANN